MKSCGRNQPVGGDSEKPAPPCDLCLRPHWAGPLLPSSLTHIGSLNAMCQLVQSCSQGAPREDAGAPAPTLTSSVGEAPASNANHWWGPKGPPPPHSVDHRPGQGLLVMGGVVTPKIHTL